MKLARSVNEYRIDDRLYIIRVYYHADKPWTRGIVKVTVSWKKEQSVIDKIASRYAKALGISVEEARDKIQRVI